MYRRIQIIVNPASGQDRPMLNVFNSVFHPAGVDWDVSVTKAAGDAYNYAKEALGAGVDAVGVYGGDGTIAEVARALSGTDMPMAVFPGGTANAVSLALNIPGDLAEACALVSGPDNQTSVIDVGEFDHTTFLIAVGLGIPGEIAEEADRTEKDRLGRLAYALNTVQATLKVPVANYHITIDGEHFEREGVTCLIANSGNFGIRGMSLSPDIDMTDGLLDVLVIRKADIPSIVALASSVVRQSEASSPFEHWCGREISIESDPPQAIQADGEVLDPSPVHARVIPHAVRIIVPKAAGPQT